MITFYYETDRGHGENDFHSPNEAVTYYQNKFGAALMCVYHENDTEDGTPFIMDYERETNGCD